LNAPNWPALLVDPKPLLKQPKGALPLAQSNRPSRQ
jgi:hypothetical protein